MKTIARAFVPLLLIIVGGCANWGSTAGLTEAEQEQLTPKMHVFAAKADFDTLLDKIADYAEQPACSETVVVACHDPEVLNQAARLATQTAAVLDQAEVAARGGGGDPEAGVQAAREALRVLSTYLVAQQIAEGVDQ